MIRRRQQNTCRIGTQLVLLFILFPYVVPAQTLVLNDSTLIQGSKIQLDDELVHVKTAAGKVTYKATDVAGYFPKGGPFFYLKPFPSINDAMLEYVPLSSKKSKKFEFIERVVDGEINLYRRVVRQSPMGTGVGPNGAPIGVKGGEQSFLFVEKGAKTYFVSSTDRIVFLMDSCEVKTQWLSRTFKGTVPDLVRQYNLSKFKSYVPVSNNVSPMYFYPYYVNGFGWLELTVNDTIKYSVPHDKVLEVKLPAHKMVKVCARSAKAQVCELVKAVPYYPVYFQIKLDAKKNSTELIASDKSNAEYFTDKYRQTYK